MAGTGSKVPCQHVGCTSWRCNSLNCSRVDPFGFRHADRVGELQEECLTPRSPPARNLPTPPAMLLPEMSRETIEMGQANMMYGNPLAAPQQFRPAHQPRPINGSPLRGLAQPAVIYLDIDQFQGAIQNLAEDVELPRTYALEEQMGTLQQRVTAIEQTHGQETIILKASKYDAMLARIRELEGRVAWYEERDRAQMPAAREEGQPSGIIKDELMG